MTNQEIEMRISAGIAILYNQKILLCHPTTLPWVNSFSIPKGGVDDGETLLEAALRETREEVGINIEVNQISNIDDPIEVLYITKKENYLKKLMFLLLR